MAADPFSALGGYLTTYEADRLATALEAGDTMAQALAELHPTRRDEARRLLTAADLGRDRSAMTVAILRAVAGARAIRTALTPVWTMPGSAPTIGRLTSEARRLIDEARMSVVCCSYNFSPGSVMWTALAAASDRPGVGVTIYLDRTTGTANKVAAKLPKATVYQTVKIPGHPRVVSHAKIIVIDQALTLLTSANFSYPAEHTNIELGLLVHDTTLAGSIEAVLRDQHGALYEQVSSG